MHKGRSYELALEARCLCSPAWYPSWFPKTYDMTIPMWQDDPGVHPVTGTQTSLPFIYSFGDDFIEYDWLWPCDIGHVLGIAIIWTLNANRRSGKWSGYGVLDGVLKWEYLNGGDGPFNVAGIGLPTPTVAPFLKPGGLITTVATPWF